MSNQLNRDTVCGLLIDMGIFPISARAAADNKNITWTDDAIFACMQDVKRSSAGALWTGFLLHGNLPPMPKPAKVKPTADEQSTYDTTCPVCKGDIRECRGLHGFVLTVPCWICHKPLAECRGECTPMVATTRRSTRNKRREDAA